MKWTSFCLSATDLDYILTQGLISALLTSAQVMIKAIDLPSSPYERCVLPDMFSEVSILERYRGVRGICQLIDFGLSSDAYWLVMKRYRCSLAEWRQKQRRGPSDAAAAAVYVSVLAQVVESLRVLARDNVVHFDLKCSNVLIDPLPGVKDSQLWNPTASSTSTAQAAAPFETVLADFGEARSYRSAEEAFTVRNRGTEVYKSPEMLMLNNDGGGGLGAAAAIGSWHTSGTLRYSGEQYNPPDPPRDSPRGRPQSQGQSAVSAKMALRGAGLASDVWSLGCLAYELLTGTVLFGGDYSSVTHRVVFGGKGNLTLTPAERAALGDREPLVALVEWVLARDPARRPALASIVERLSDIHAGLMEEAAAADSA